MMNRGHVLQSSPVQQMAAAGNPNWWSMMRPPPPLHHQPSPSPFLPHPSNLFPHQYSQFAPPSSSLPNYFLYDTNHDQELHNHESLSQLLLGGLVDEEVDHHHHNKSGMNHFHEVLHNNNNVVAHVKQETSSSSYNMYGHGHHHANHRHEEDDASATKPDWSLANNNNNNNLLNVSNSPKSCLSHVNTNMLDFSSKNDVNLPRPDRSSESNSSTGSGGASKKAKVRPSSTQSSSTTIKVRKEKLGDRITSLHQLVSPFGKTDTASVLLEAIGYIRFLQNQIEALSLPYLDNGSGNNNNNARQLRHHQQFVQGDRNCLFPEDPGQLLNDNCLKRKGAPLDQTCNEEPKNDLKSKGLCLVPVSCMLQVGSDNGADYWAPSIGAGAGFR